MRHAVEIAKTNEESYMELWCDVQQFGPAKLFLNPRIPDHFFNFLTNVNAHSIVEIEYLIERAIQVYASFGVPFQIFVSNDPRYSNLVAQLEESNFQYLGERSVLVRIGDRDPPGDFSELTIRPVERSKIAQWSEVAIGTWWKSVYPSSYRRDVVRAIEAGVRQDELVCYLAYLGDLPVGTGLMNILEESVGIHGLTTLPKYRRRGVSAAISRTIIRDALEKRMFLICAQAKTRGQSESVLMRLGFERACTFLRYGK